MTVEEGKLKVAPRGSWTAARKKRPLRGVAVVLGAIAVVFAGLMVSWVVRSATPRVRAERAEERGQDPMPYVNYVPVRKEDRGKAGTTINIAGDVEKGYHLFAPKPESGATLIDLEGEVIHKWASKIGQPDPVRPTPSSYIGWQHVKLLPNGDILAIVSHGPLMKFDWDSKLLWRAPINAHHDVAVGANGEIYCINEVSKVVDIGGKKRLIADHGVAVLSADGKLERRISYYDLAMKDPDVRAILESSVAKRFRNLDKLGIDGLLERNKRKAEEEDEDVAEPEGSAKRVPAGVATLALPGATEKVKKLMADGKLDGDNAYEGLLIMRAIPGFPGDVFHANTVLPLKAHPAGLWKDGDLLTSLRALNTVMVIDPKEEKIVWSWGNGVVMGQHQPSMLENGNLLVFDNGVNGMPKDSDEDKRKYSRVIELDPKTKQIVWEYTGSPKRSFYTPAEGGCQMLPGGNILVAQGEFGRAFEITRDKEIVWEYFNPKFDPTGRRRSGFYRMEWYAPSVVDPLLKK